MSISVTHKKRGRPATGQDPHLTVRLPEELKRRIEDYAASRTVSRTEAVRTLLEAGFVALKQDD